MPPISRQNRVSSTHYPPKCYGFLEMLRPLLRPRPQKYTISMRFVTTLRPVPPVLHPLLSSSFSSSSSACLAVAPSGGRSSPAPAARRAGAPCSSSSAEHTSELQSHSFISY